MLPPAGCGRGAGLSLDVIFGAVPQTPKEGAARGSSQGHPKLSGGEAAGLLR